MYADLGPGQMLDLDLPSPNDVDLLFSHEYVAERTRNEKRPSSLTLAELLNIYAYVMNNPVNNVDPSGLATASKYYFCLEGVAACFGTCTCTWSRGNFGLITVMLLAEAGCCAFSCLCGHASPKNQTNAMARCMNTAVRSFGGAAAAPTSCSCT